MAGRLMSSVMSTFLSKHFAGLSIQTLNKVVPTLSQVKCVPHSVTSCMKLHTASLLQPNPQVLSGCSSIIQPSYTQRLLQATTVNQQQVRTRTMFSRRHGGPRTVTSVVKRFFRLHNGMWIRTRAGRHKKLWKKKGVRVAHLQHHVFCTQRQCWMLDRMVNKYYKIPKYYANDSYAPYHLKKNLPMYNYNKPRFLP